MEIDHIAQQLKTAENTQIVCEPIRSYIAEKDLQTAYKIQEINIKKELANGKKEIGKKIGLTSFKVQEQLGVDQPDFGILLDSMQLEANTQVPFSIFMQPKVETEIAFILREDLTKQEHTIEEIEAAIDYAVLAIEIVGSRIKDWNIRITDTIADNASSSHFILGDKKMPLSTLDLINNKMKMYVNGKLVSQGDGTSCLGNPLNAVVWLADKMVAMNNPLKKGEVILSGALGPMAILNSGDTVKAEIEGLGKLEFSTK